MSAAPGQPALERREPGRRAPAQAAAAQGFRVVTQAAHIRKDHVRPLRGCTVTPGHFAQPIDDVIALRLQVPNKFASHSRHP